MITQLVLIDGRRHHGAMRTKIAIALGIVYVVWGSTYLAIAVADRTLPPLLMQRWQRDVNDPRGMSRIRFGTRKI